MEKLAGVNVEQELIKAAILELMGCYKKYRSTNFSQNIVVPGKMTNLIQDDFHTMFIIRTWYSPRYLESLTDEEQDGVDHMLDGFDKLSDFMGDDESIMARYNFMIDDDDLLNANNELMTGMNFEEWQNSHKNLSLVKMRNEMSHVEIIAGQMDLISKK